MRASLAAALNLAPPRLRAGIKAPMDMLTTRQPTTPPVAATAGILTPAAVLATVAAALPVPAVAQTAVVAPATAVVGAVATSHPCS